MLQKIISKFLSYKYTVSFALFLTLLTGITLGFRLNFILYGFLNSIFILSLVYLISKLNNKPAMYFLLAPLSFLVFLDSCVILSTRKILSLELLASIYETTPREMLIMSRTYAVPLLLLVVVFMFIFFSSFNEIKKINIRVTKVVLLSFLVVLIPVAKTLFVKNLKLTSFDSEVIQYKISTESNRFDLSNSQYFSSLLKKCPFIFHTFLLNYTYYVERSEIDKYTLGLRKVPNELTFTPEKTSQYHKIYFVIGESLTRNHMSLYGYKVKTTPLLESLVDKNHLKYYYGLSSFLYTRIAVPSIITPNNELVLGNLYSDYYSIVELARKANYHTIWLSNQHVMGIYDGPVAAIANTADYCYFNQRDDRDDFQLLDLLSKQTDTHKSELIVLHLQGSHRDFSTKYDSMDLLDSIGDKDIDQYNFSVHHTDRLLDKLYSMLGPEDLIIFTSDHGEIPSTKLGRHGGKDLFAFEVPLLVISKGTLKTHLIDEFVSPFTGLINNSSLYWILADYLGYELNDSNFVTSLVEEGDRVVSLFNDNEKVSIR